MNYYKVTAVWGASETSATNEVSFRKGAPTSLTATSAATKITLAWSSVTGATSYKLKRAPQAGGPYSIVSAGAISPFNDTTVTPDVGYHYVVASNFADGSTSEDSPEASGMAGSATIPSGLSIVSYTSTSVKLAWSAVANATSYQVYRGTTSGGPYTAIGSAATSPTQNITGLTNNGTHYFVVTATVSGTESATSSEVFARTFAPPSAPQAFPGNNQVDLILGFTAGAASYSIERSTDSVNYTLIASGLGSTSYNDSTAVNGTLYFYRYKPVFASGAYSSFSAPSLGVTPGVTPLVPSGVMILTNDSGTDVDLTWGAVAGASSYNIKSASVSGGPYTTVLSGSASTTVNIASLTADVPVYFVVSALNGTLESANSTEISVVPNIPAVAPSVTAGTPGQVDVSWTPIAGALTYDVLRSDNSLHFTTVASALATTSYSDTTVVNGSAYIYRYLPNYAAGTPGAQSADSITVTPGVQPLAPLALVGNSIDPTSINLSWVQVPNAVSFNIKRGATSGGPYTTIGTSASTTYADTGLTPGVDYYYVVTSVNSSGVESNNSNEVGLSTLAAPAGLGAVNSGNTIQLSWSASIGASTYTVKRGLTASGPYGIIAAAIAPTSYTDTNIEDGITYYYVVVANAASGAHSPNSSEVSAVGSVKMNLQVPIELTDQSINSDTTPIRFERTMTSLDPASYDGTVTYFAEAVAWNSDSTPRAIYIVDSTGTSIGAITVPASMTGPARIRTGIAPNPAADVYRIELDGTTAFAQLRVYSARLIVNQVGATKTKLYFPLLSSSNSPSSADLTAFVERTFATSYSELASASIYKRDTSFLKDLYEYEAWDLETLVAATGGAKGAVALYNRTKSLVVDDTETLFTSASIELSNSPFDEGVSGFGSVDELNEYQVSLRCYADCGAGSASLYKAGLWVSLSNLSKVEVIYRNNLAATGIYSTTNFDLERTLMDLSVFSNPAVYFQAVASAPSGGDLTLTLMSAGTSDSSLAALTSIGGSALSYYSTSKGYQRTAGAVTITSGDRFVTEATPTVDAASIVDTAIVIRAYR
jgi:fibronectin type 3 domain-containing protein